MALSDLLFGRPQQFQQIPRLSPQNLDIKNQLGGMGLEGLQQLLKGGQGFAPIAQKQTSNFYQNIVPGIAERFTSAGAGGQRSSAFQGALGQAGSGLAESLASMESQYNLQNHGNLLKQLNLGLSPDFDTVNQPRQPGLGDYGAMSLDKILPLLLSLLTGGGIGAAGGGLAALLSQFGGGNQ